MATIPIFDGTNYECWKVKMKTLFLSEDLWDTVQVGFGNAAERAAAIEQGVEAGQGDDIELGVDADQGDDIELGVEAGQGVDIGQGIEQGGQDNAKALSFIHQGVSNWIFPIIMRARTASAALALLDREYRGPTRPFRYRNVITATDLRQTGANHLIVATLIATMGFTAGFTMPGGYNSYDGLNQGMAILTREAAFKAFMVTDTIAMSLSILAVLILFYAAITNNRDMLESQVYAAAYLIIYAVFAMVLAFVTGTYVVLAHSSGLAISVCVIGCLPLFLFLITRIIKKFIDLEDSFMGSCLGTRGSRPRRWWL